MHLGEADVKEGRCPFQSDYHRDRSTKPKMSLCRSISLSFLTLFLHNLQRFFHVFCAMVGVHIPVFQGYPTNVPGCSKKWNVVGLVHINPDGCMSVDGSGRC